MAGAPTREFESFAAFYPYYLSEHQDRTCRRLHFAGSTVALLCLLMLVVTGSAWWLLGAVLSGYAFAWVGHFVFEKNRPATFRHPFYSLMGDWVMYADILRGRIPF
ncbi:Mpo1-like protein [Cupriavidus numazuensis]|uniref:DUF962 domain-containing protein n=1 Tax=Cupriavidus numazuensis TaxID=221992 RepID=A0ABN7PPM2_9BURK|nr:Mpo1-like protein [Cupriavidus numazuensis]CAG2128767.1 hypothetical protein LMG26411_00058 [Cupriavidus numazuensis]